jgi:hypothetical protein
MESGLATVKVCGKPCNILSDLSTAASVKCEVPAIQTEESIKTFYVDKPGNILGKAPNGQILASTT